MATPDPCYSKCYSLAGAPARDAVFQNMTTGTLETQCLTACNAAIATLVDPQTLARVLVDGNTTFDAANPLGNLIVGVEYTLDLDTATSSIAPTPLTTTGDGVNFSVNAQSSTTGFGGSIFVNSGDTTSGASGALNLNAGSSTTGTAGTVNVNAGTSTTGLGGSLNLNAGESTVSGNGGSLVGAGGDTVTGEGGSVDFRAGSSSLLGGGGPLNLTAGTAFNGQGGDVLLSGGTSSSGGRGGHVFIQAGSSSAAIGEGAHVRIIAGLVSSPNTTPAPDVYLVPGYNPSVAALGKNGSGSVGINATLSSADASAHFVALQTALPTAVDNIGNPLPTVAPRSSDMAGAWAGAAVNFVGIVFHKSYAFAPFVVVSSIGAVVPVTVVPTAAGFTVTSTLVDMTGFSWICIGGSFV